MAKQAAGHETAGGKDAFELTDEEFKAQLSAIQDGEDTGPAAEEVHEPDTSAPADDDAAPTDQETAPADTAPGPDEGTPGKPASEELFEIKHDGEIHRLERAKLIELAQKGFDYDRKIGPHRRIVEIVNSDPGAAQALNEYLKGRLEQAKPAAPDTPRLKPLNEYEDETEWLRDNVQALQQSTPDRKIELVETMLFSRDPDHYHEVAPYLKDHADKLTVEEHRRIEAGDMRALIRFYDQVKEIRTGKPKAAPAAAPVPQKPVTPAFRAKPGGGEPPRNPKDTPEYVWAMPTKDFKAALAKLKGY